MHRFIEHKTVGAAPSCDLQVAGEGVADNHARLALRSDGSIWLLAEEGCSLRLERGAGWLGATRIRLCEGDRVEVGASAFDVAAAAAIFSATPLSPEQLPASTVSGLDSPRPLAAPGEVMERPRRNPGTGQVEHQQSRPEEDNE